MTTDNKVLTKIQNRCDTLGWSMYRLSKESDIPYSSLNNMFKRNTTPTISTLEKICEGFQISLSDFFIDYTSTTHEVLTTNERIIVHEYRSLSKKKRELLEAYIKGLQSN